MDQEKIDQLTPVETPPETLKAMMQLIEDGKNDVARLPEPLFVSHLLPVLTDRSGEVDVSIWMDIAGHGFRPIDVYNPATNEVLFRVPALYARIPTESKFDSRRSLTMVVQEAGQRSMQHPAIGQTFLRMQLNNREVQGNINWDQVRQWNAILARYGHAPIVELPNPDQPTVATAASSGELIAGEAQDDF